MLGIAKITNGFCVNPFCGFSAQIAGLAPVLQNNSVHAVMVSALWGQNLGSVILSWILPAGAKDSQASYRRTEVFDVQLRAAFAQPPWALRKQELFFPS